MKYKKFTPSGGKNIGIRKSAFVTNAQFQWELENYGMCRVNRTINYISGFKMPSKTICVVTTYIFS